MIGEKRVVTLRPTDASLSSPVWPDPWAINSAFRSITDMRANLHELFLLDEAFEERAVRAAFCSKDIDFLRLSAGQCPDSIQMTRHSGSKAFDLVGTTRHGIYLFSPRLQDALRSTKVTGWQPCPVTFFSGRPNEELRQYAAIGITARCGGLDNTRSIRTMTSTTKTGKSVPRWVGIYFDEETWDGSDMFRPVGTMLTIVTSRVKNLLEGVGVTNVRLRKVLEVERLAS